MQITRTIRRREVLNKVGICATTLYKLEKAGEFPQHFMLTPRIAAWDEADVNAWLAQRKISPAKAIAAPDVSLRKSRVPPERA